MVSEKPEAQAKWTTFEVRTPYSPLYRGKIAKDARLALEQKTGKKVVTGESFLPAATRNAVQLSGKNKKKVKEK
ncbi:MAG: hypothetical protein ACHQRM_17175 [Bacteroidia bacterium]